MILHTHPKEVNKARYILVISETDGYFVNGIEVTSRVSVGHRSLKIKDYAKTSQAVRLRPVTHVLELAKNYFPLEKRAYFAQLKAYQIIPEDELLNIEWVTLDQHIGPIIGTPR